MNIISNQMWYKKLFYMLTVCLFSAPLSAQTVNFMMEEQQTGEEHHVEVNLSQKTIQGYRSSGTVVFRNSFYEVDTDERGYVAFSFDRGKAPLFYPSSDGKTSYFIITSQLMIGTKDLSDNSAYQYRPVSQPTYQSAYERLLDKLNEIREQNRRSAVIASRLPDRSFTVKGETFRMLHVDAKIPGVDIPLNGGYATRNIPSADYKISQSLVSQALWNAVMKGEEHSYGGNYAVEDVSWGDFQQFIEKLNMATGETFRLPTRAELEDAESRGLISGRNGEATSGSDGEFLPVFRLAYTVGESDYERRRIAKLDAALIEATERQMRQDEVQRENGVRRKVVYYISPNETEHQKEVARILQRQTRELFQKNITSNY